MASELNRPLTQDEAEAILRGFAFNDPDAEQRLEDLLHSDVAPSAAAAVLHSGVVAAPLWAAAYVYAWTAVDTQPLVPLIAHIDPTISLIAAEALLARGDAAGFEPLIDKLTDMRPVQGYSPPGPIWRSALVALVRHTAVSALGPPLDADEFMLVPAAQRWRAWLAANRERLAFDADTGLWTT
jgi:hypothetical protein